MKEENEFLKQENYFDEYQKSIDALKNDPKLVEIDKLCYVVFQTEDGKKLLNEFIERYLIPGFVSPAQKNAAMAALYFEGFKHAYRIIVGSIKSHQQRIDAENKKQ